MAIYRYESFLAYAKEYKNAVLLLCETKEGLNNLRNIIYPLNFLFRHFLELELKGLLCFKDNEIYFRPFKHDLRSLFRHLKLLEKNKKVRGLLKNRALNTSILFYSGKNSGFDKNSYSFRYPEKLNKEVDEDKEAFEDVVMADDIFEKAPQEYVRLFRDTFNVFEKIEKNMIFIERDKNKILKPPQNFN